MREDETNTDGSPTVNIEIMTNHENGTDNRTEDENLKTLKTTSSLEEDNLKTKSRGKRDEGAMFLGGYLFDCFKINSYRFRFYSPFYCSEIDDESLDMCTDRRKRKSCETETAVEVKRVRTQSADDDKPYQPVEVPQNEIDQAQADSPKTDDSSSSNTTSGVDVTDQPGPSSTSRDNERLEIVNISSFIRYEPCDTKSARPLKSAIKKPDKSGENRTNDKSIKFDVVREFRFNRTQSFVTMPSQGGMSLGMGKTHTTLLSRFIPRCDNASMIRPTS